MTGGISLGTQDINLAHSLMLVLLLLYIHLGIQQQLVVITLRYTIRLVEACNILLILTL